MTPPGSLLVRSAKLGARSVDVSIRDGRVAAIGAGLTGEARVIDARGARLLPGLHDHHIHLLATAAADRSVRCGPPDVRTPAQFAAALAHAPGTGFVRGVGYDGAVAGLLDRAALDRFCAGRPVRVQDRSGTLWVLNSAALKILGLTAEFSDGRLWRRDDLLRARLLSHGVEQRKPDLAALGSRLAGYGITGVTDATPGDASNLATLAGAMPQRVVTLGEDPTGDLIRGPVKLVVSDHALPGLDELAARIGRAHQQSRAVAVHCVTREALLLSLAALDIAGVYTGDRIEHAAVVPPEAAAAIASRGLTVVTQPSLLARHGDAYVREVDPADLPYLWPFASLLASGVRVGCSSDAPYGDPHPWRSIEMAVTRQTPDGCVVGPEERVDAETALAAYLTPWDDPGGPIRAVEPGRPADLVLLSSGTDGELWHDRVRMTIIGGRVVYETDAA